MTAGGRVPLCDREEAVARAVRTNGTLTGEGWTEDLRAHARTCAVCADVVLVASFLGSETASAAAAPLPDPGLVYWKALLRSRREAAERAVKPIAFAERVAIAGALVAVSALLAWLHPDVRGLLTSLASAFTLPAHAAAASFTAAQWLTVAALGLLPVFIAISVLQSRLLRD